MVGLVRRYFCGRYRRWPSYVLSTIPRTKTIFVKKKLFFFNFLLVSNSLGHGRIVIIVKAEQNLLSKDSFY